MKSRLHISLPLALIIALLGMSTLAYAELPSQRTLALGSWGEDVFWLQRKLMDLGFMDEATGRYGKVTQKAIKELQRAHGLKADGIAGPQTFSLLVETESFSYYTVQKGDSLYSIAKQYNIPMEDLVNLNTLTATHLQIGQRLKVPRQPTPVTYIVVSGDNLHTIARTFKVTVGEIVALNSIDNAALIKPGQELIIPKGSH